jgi:hypothetical protein
MASLEPLALPLFVDERGKLSVGEIGAGLPFVPHRYFLVYDVPHSSARGGHAHKKCEQFMIAVSGSVAIALDDGSDRVNHVLDRPDLGLHVPAYVWGEQRYLTPNSRLLVLASEPYDREDYIASYDEFLRLVARRA